MSGVMHEGGRATPAHIVGVGAVSGYGWGIDALFGGLDSQTSCVTRYEGLAGYFDEDFAYLAPIDTNGGKHTDGPSTFMRAMRAAAREAVLGALAAGWVPGDRVGMVHSIVAGDLELWGDYLRIDWYGKKVKRSRWVAMMPSTAVSLTMNEFDFHGPSMSVSAMCSSSNVGLITAKSWLDSGRATDVLCISTDVSSGGTLTRLRGFGDVGVMVTNREPLDACRPFQEGTAGFLGGEAAVAILLLRTAVGSRGALLGGAMNMDASSAVGIDPAHTELFSCVKEALVDAGVDQSEIAYLNAHGPGTVQCNVAEGRVIDELLPDLVGAFSIKPWVGHCQGASGAIEVLASVYAFDTGFIPATPHVSQAHAKLLDGRIPRRPGLTLKSTVGMGGYNAMTVLAGPEDI